MAQTNYRSPNYPRLALDAALAKARLIYGKQHKHAASRDVIAQALGYKNFNTGTAKAVIASLKASSVEFVGDGRGSVSRLTEKPAELAARGVERALLILPAVIQQRSTVLDQLQ